MHLSMQDIKNRLNFKYEGYAPITSSEAPLIADLSALVAQDVHEALRIEFKLAKPLTLIGQSVSFYSLPKQPKSNRSSRIFSDAYAYLAVVETDGVCHAVFICGVFDLAEAIRRLEPLSVI